MIPSIKSLLSEWQYIRGNTLKFITFLSDDDFDKILPRKQLNTIRLQAEELAQIQRCYVYALATCKLDFTCTPLDDKSRQGLIDTMAILDKQLENTLSTFDGTEKINWYGESKNIHEHLAAMISHEAMHIGQIIAFCYATEITIPDVIVNAMALDG